MSIRKFVILVTTLLLGSLLLNACTPTGGEPPAGSDTGSEPAAADQTAGGEEKTMYVGPETAECVGVAPQTCLQVKESPDAEYTLFYDSIEGFTYEPGYEYELRVRVETVENPPADGSSLRYILIEEVSKTPVETTSASPLEGVLWQLSSYVNAAGETVAALPDVSSTATFENGSVGGNDGCNNFGASYVVDGASITITPGPTTLMACPPPIDEQAAGFNAALAQAAAYSIDGTTLTLTDTDGNVLATFEAVEPTALEGTTWVVTMLNNGKEAVVGVIPDSELTAVFNPDGTLNGNGGCNNYFGGFAVDGDSISIGELGMTEMACTEPEGLMDQEQQYLAALQTAATYSIQANRLELRTADGALAVSFEARPAAELAGTAWNVVNFNNGNEAVVTVINGTELTANFGADGTLNGSAGCNNYNAGYTVDGDTISIGPAASTRMLCSEPEGVMEQEAQYLAALSTAATWRIDGDQLELRTADGAIAAIFQAQ